jgi:hypothetical protein
VGAALAAGEDTGHTRGGAVLLRIVVATHMLDIGIVSVQSDRM